MEDIESKIQITQSKKNLIEMIEERGFVFDRPLLDAFNKSNKSYNFKLSNPDINKGLLVLFSLQPKFKREELREWYQIAKKYSSDNNNININLLLILKDEVNTTVLEKTKIEENTKNKPHVYGEIWKISNLQYNISNNYLVPKHIILTDIDKLEELGYKKDHLPKILHSDPMAKRLGAVPGNIIEVQRNSETSGCNLVYRLVV